MVDAALIGLDVGEVYTWPSVADETLWKTFETASNAIRGRRVRHARPALPRCLMRTPAGRPTAGGPSLRQAAWVWTRFLPFCLAA